MPTSSSATRDHRSSSQFGAVVRRLRDQRGWTREQLAYRAQLSVSIIAKIEDGDVARSHARTLRSIAGAFEIPVEELDGATLARVVTEKADTLDKRRAVNMLLDLSPDEFARAMHAIERAKRRK